MNIWIHQKCPQRIESILVKSIGYLDINLSLLLNYLHNKYINLKGKKKTDNIWSQSVCNFRRPFQNAVKLLARIHSLNN